MGSVEIETEEEPERTPFLVIQCRGAFRVFVGRVRARESIDGGLYARGIRLSPSFYVYPSSLTRSYLWHTRQ